MQNQSSVLPMVTWLSGRLTAAAAVQSRLVVLRVLNR